MKALKIAVIGIAAAFFSVVVTSPATALGSAEQEIAGHDGDAPADPGPKARLSGSLRPADVRAATRKVADWELDHASPYFGRTWTWGALYTGFMATTDALNDPRFRDAMLSMSETFQWQLRSSLPNADDQSVAQTYLELYLRKRARKEIEPTQTTLAKLIAGAAPAIPPGQARIPWWWCDSLFMAPPVWARMYAATHDRKYLDYLHEHFWQTSALLYDIRHHLYFRDITFLHRADPHGNPIFWSRGEGWVMAGIARTLQYLPKSDTDYARYRTQLRQMAAAVAALQDPKNGLWHSELLDPEDYPQPEVSGSALITFALAWGVNNGILDRTTYMPVIAAAWRGLVGQIYADGRLGNIQPIGAAPAHYGISRSDP